MEEPASGVENRDRETSGNAVTGSARQSGASDKPFTQGRGFTSGGRGDGDSGSRVRGGGVVDRTSRGRQGVSGVDDLDAGDRRSDGNSRTARAVAGGDRKDNVSAEGRYDAVWFIVAC